MKTSRKLFSQKLNISGAPEGLDAYFLIKKIRKEGRSIIHISRDDARALALKKTINFFDPSLLIIDFPAWDCLPYDLVSPNKAISSARLAALLEIMNSKLKPFIIITTVNAVSQRVPEQNLLRKSFTKVKVGLSFDREKFITNIVDLGYQNASSVFSVGEFSVRGGLIDIFPPSSVSPVRIDFFGNQVDRIRLFNPESQMSGDFIDEVLISAVSEFYLNEENIKRFRRNYRSIFGVNGLNDPLYEAISNGNTFLGYEHWGPLFNEKMETLLDYTSNMTELTMDYMVDEAILKRREMIEMQYENRSLDFQLSKSNRKKYKPLDPNFLYLSLAEWTELSSRAAIYLFHPMKLPTGLNSINLGGETGRDFTPERQSKAGILFKSLIAYLEIQRKQCITIIACYSSGSRERIENIFSDAGFVCYKRVQTFLELNQLKTMVGLTVLPIEKGFTSPNLIVISERDILGERFVRPKLSSKKGKDFIRDLSVLNINDLVIHVEHGLGRYIGLEKIETLGVSREYLALEYSGQDKLLIPIENIDILSRYGGQAADLDKLGTTAWQAKRSRVKRRIFDMAEKLIKIAAERKMAKSHIFLKPEYLWDDFCARFPYEETEDQLKAIQDVLSDLESGQPMDRLVCGDVGFGKTEVAIRAALVVASAGKQVVIVTPTTLLCSQHFKTFQLRFSGLPFEIVQLSRLIKPKIAVELREKIKNGTANIIIGTHTLLNNKTNFSDLGLVIIDEEQHFGVAHKERLKNLKSKVHVLTLTATPIPRTLQLALSGARELSIISTPPVDRYSVRTFVSQFDGLTIKDALMREQYRGGQSFFVVPRISDIDRIEAFLAENLPALKISSVHGRMPAKQLDNTMSAFYERQFDVLVATSIIESGLDIPSVNTLIVYRADLFGLAQLYQIRGRVGRSRIRGYAYLILDSNKIITPQAERRLNALSDLENLGAGFSLASQDLDIRGAGNLLGDEQSGQIREVGYELYQHMLEEAVAKIKNGQSPEDDPLEEIWSPEINLNVSVLIPEHFVPDTKLRLDLYRRLSVIKNIAELNSFSDEVSDRFGKLPSEFHMLINIMKIKNKCFEAGIVKFEGGPKGATIKFYRDRFKNPKAIIDYIQSQRGTVKVKDSQLIIRREWNKSVDRIKGAFALVCEIAKQANK